MADLDAITERILGCAFRVSTGLGPGFLEKLYENALVIALERASLLPGCLLLNFGAPRLEIRRLHPSPSWPRPVAKEPSA